jgi:hypothetical protein
MNSRTNRHSPVAALVSVVPEMAPAAPKRNLVVGLSYLLLLWVSSARLIAMLTVG